MNNDLPRTFKLVTVWLLLGVLVFVGIHTMLAIGLNLLLGYAGQISLGHAGFFGMGAYLSGILTSTYGWNPWLAMPLAALFVGNGETSAP